MGGLYDSLKMIKCLSCTTLFILSNTIPLFCLQLEDIVENIEVDLAIAKTNPQIGKPKLTLKNVWCGGFLM